MEMKFQSESFRCPRCGKDVKEYPAMSRRANVKICPDCGKAESTFDYLFAESGGEGFLLIPKLNMTIPMAEAQRLEKSWVKEVKGKK